MDFDDLDDAEVADEGSTTNKLEEARDAGFAPAHELPKIDGVYCFSDADCGEKGSQTFIRRLTLPGDKKQEMGSLNRISQSALIVAGGFGGSPNDLHTCFQIMSTRVSDIHFVPGALELHIKSDADFNDLPDDERRYHNSLEKAKYLMSSFCKYAGVTATPKAYDCGGEAVWVVPILSHCAPSFDAEPDVGDSASGVEAIKASRDFVNCVWPKDLDPMTDDVANAMDGLNDWLRGQMAEDDRVALEKVLKATPAERMAAATHVVTYSHFVPRPDLIPEKRFLPSPEMAKQMGSNVLKKRVASIRPDVHVFARSCFGWDATLGGVRYVSAPLATLEQRLRGDAAIGDFPHFEKGEPLMLRQGSSWATPYIAGWSEYYKNSAREERSEEARASGPSKGAAFAPEWVEKSIKSEAEGYVMTQGGAHAGFTYGRV